MPKLTQAAEFDFIGADQPQTGVNSETLRAVTTPRWIQL
jgi:hypothetical protein